MRKPLSNDNRELDANGLDPDRHATAAAAAMVCEELRAQGVDRNTIARALLDELFKMLDGNPFRTGHDEGIIRADQEFLWAMKHRIVPMSEQWDKAWLRLRFERQMSYRFNRAAQRPDRLLPPRLQAPPADYDEDLHRSDLMILKMRRGHVYSEREVMVRFRRKMERAQLKRYVEGYDRVQGLIDARDRVLGWMSRTADQATVRETA